MAGTPPRLQSIQSRAELAAHLGVPLHLVTRRAFGANQALLYFESRQRKRSGGERVIHAPRWPLANIQRKLLRLLEELYRPSSRVMGFVKGRGIKKNATFHVGKRLVLNVDIENYFGSIHAGRIRRRLMAPPYNLSNDVATTIAKLCTLDGVLPTGAPTSPILANIVTSSLDGALATYAKGHGCFYTRYADDITFSTNRRSLPQGMVRRSDNRISGLEVGTDLNDEFVRAGFSIQPAKTRLMTSTARKEVCSVTCNERLNVRRSLMREVRGAINAWRKYGRPAAEAVWEERFNWRGATSFERSLRGRIEHIIHIRGENDKATANLVSQFNALPDRTEKDLRYSYSDDNPLGILESVCLINCADDAAKQWSQGTGFVLDGGRVITNHHVVTYRPTDDDGNFLKDDGGRLLPLQIFPEIEIQFEQSPLTFRMKVVYSDEKKDIALLRCEDPVWSALFKRKACRLSFRELARGAAVELVGYPHHTPGGSCKVVPGVVTGTSVIEGQKYFNVSQSIVKGNSGGPVVDQFGQVVGIATKGVEASDIANSTFNGCIPIHAVDPVILSGS